MLQTIRILSAAAALLTVASAHSQAFVLLPSIGLDQRFDDNFRLLRGGSETLSATRLVANLGLNRESSVSQIRGLLRADALLSVSKDTPDELDSNQFAFIDSRFTKPRSSTGLRLNYKFDTPNRDISSDITDLSVSASDSGAAVTQDQNVDRERLVFNPEFAYNLSRLSELELDYKYTQVDHGLPSCQDALAAHVQLLADLGQEPEANPVFSPVNELDDFKEHALLLTYRRSLSRITSFSVSAGYSEFEAQEIQDQGFDAEIEDERCKGLGFNVRRDPRSSTTVKTSRITFGYERQFSELIKGSGQLGYYSAESNEFGEVTDSDGYIFNVTVEKKAEITTFSGKFGVEVFPSDIGDVVETLELVGDLTREVNPLLDFNLRIRAFEPDAISDENNDDEFARRFLSLEPKLSWRLKRNWTVAGSYRYRRQKTQANPEVAESNALLLTLKYTPPSKLGDLAQ